MREVRLLQLHIPRPVRQLLPVLPLALGIVAVAVADQGSSPNTQPVTSSSSPTPASSPQETSQGHTATDVTVNGQRVPVNADGSAAVNLPGGGKLNVSDGNTTLSTAGGSASGSGGSRNVNVNVNSNSTNDSGSGWSSTQITGDSNNANGSSTSFSSTNVFSTSSNNYESSQ